MEQDNYKEHELHKGYDPKCSTCFSENMAVQSSLDFSGKANGLHSGTKFYEYREGQHTIQYHEHPETGELVILDTWYVQNGEDDVDSEWEVIGVYPPLGCELAKMNAPYMKDGHHFLMKK